MKQKLYVRTTFVYAIAGFIIIIAIFVNQFLGMKEVKTQIFVPADVVIDTLTSDSDSLEINWEDVGY